MDNLVGLFWSAIPVEDLTCFLIPSQHSCFPQGKLAFFSQVEETTSLDKGKNRFLGGDAVINKLEEAIVGGGVPQFFADLFPASVKV